MKRVHVICGGQSDERDVSLRSGAAVATALQASGYKVAVFDTTDKIGDIIDCDVVFPVLHGAGGEDGTLQAMLEERSVPFVGSGSVASRLCFDKWEYRQTLSQDGIVMPEGQLVDNPTFRSLAPTLKSFVLKPFDGGSSVDTFIVRNGARFSTAAIRSAFKRHGRMLLEELVEGTEITVGILGDAPLPVVEIIPPVGAEFDYENKYNGRTAELCPPHHVAEAVQKHAQTLALRIHTLTGCRDFSRTDMIVDRKHQLYVLETNTIPGMTEQSLLPKMAATAGVDMSALVDYLVKAALER